MATGDENKFRYSVVAECNAILAPTRKKHMNENYRPTAGRPIL